MQRLGIRDENRPDGLLPAGALPRPRRIATSVAWNGDHAPRPALDQPAAGEYRGDAIERLFTNRLDPAAHPYFRDIAV